ncbi:MAG: monovalent cation/H+ antiporter subunit D [Lautropia sp.]
MNHWIIAPVVLPLMTGALMLALRRRAGLVAAASLASTAALLAICVGLLIEADGGRVGAYLVGNWQAPYGIVLVLDRLSAMLLVLTAALALATLVYARGGDDARGAHFHALFQFQLMGVNGAFLTGDLFNLFVFFEVLLIASYGLLLHGATRARLRASLHYVGFNLVGASVFLIAVSLLYGATGTLNMADLAQRVAELPPERARLAHSAALLLMVVFFVKAALLPLHFWLPATYGAASAPVAALFAIMTKVGVYAVLRTSTLVFGEQAGLLARIAEPWVSTLALATIAVAAIGALASGRLREQIGYLVIGSAGTVLLGAGLGRPDTIAAGLFYLVNSTFAAAALFLVADRVAAGRGEVDDTLAPASFDASRERLGVVFFACAIAAAGVPPLAGFLGKTMLLQAAGAGAWGGWIVAIVLASSLLVMVALARSGSVLFWSPAAVQARAAAAPSAPRGAPVPPGPTPALPGGPGPLPSRAPHGLALALLLAAILGCTAAAGPIARYALDAAAQLLDRRAYLDAVLGARPAPPAYDVRREMRERRDAQPLAGDPPPRKAGQAPQP